MSLNNNSSRFSSENLESLFRSRFLKGIESKKHFNVGKGVLGDHKEKINDLIERML